MELISRDAAKELGLKRYFTGDQCKNGHVDERHVASYCCCTCGRDKVRESSRKRYAEDPEYKARITEKNRAQAKTEAYRARNRKRTTTERYREYRVAYLSQDHMREKKRAYDKTRQATDQYKESIRAKYRDDKHHRIACIMRSRLVACVRKAKIGKGSVSVRDIDIEKLMTRIEFNFKPGMTWDNHGEWHIDHVKPVAAFIAQGRDLGLINSLCNLRPEWKSDNMLKSSKFNGVMYRYKSTQSIRNEEDKG